MSTKKEISKVFVVGILFLVIVSSIPLTGVGSHPKEVEQSAVSQYERYKESWYVQHIHSEPTENEVHPPEVINEESTGVVGGPMDSPWSMKCHDIHHTGRSQYSTANTSSIEKWRFRTGWIENSAVIDNNGTIYVGSYDFKLYAIYPNGTLKWKYMKIHDTISSAPAIASDGTVYVTTFDYYMDAIYPDGTQKWRFYVGDPIISSPAIAEDGTIYFGVIGPEYKGRIYAVNPNGTDRWHYDTGYWITSDPAIGTDGTIYIGSWDTYLYAMNPNGSLRWRFKTGDYIYGQPSIAEDGTIYIGSWDDYLYALYPNGTMKWRVNTGVGTSASASIGDDGTIYVGADKLYAIYPNGVVKWEFNSGTGKSSPAISADGTIYIGSGKNIIAVNHDGTERWRKQIATQWVESSPAIAKDGTIYIGSSSWEEIQPGGYAPVGYLHAFGPGEQKTIEITQPKQGENFTCSDSILVLS